MISLIFQGRVRNLVDEGAAVVMGIHYDAEIEEKNQENDQEPYGFPCISLVATHDAYLLVHGFGTKFYHTKVGDMAITLYVQYKIQMAFFQEKIEKDLTKRRNFYCGS